MTQKKVIKAWAVINKTGEICHYLDTIQDTVIFFRFKKDAEQGGYSKKFYKVVPVIIKIKK